MNTVEKKINVELLERVKAHILEEPRRFDMSTFVARASDPSLLLAPDMRPACGTVACIAGWAVFLSSGLPKKITEDLYESIESHAAGLLGLGLEAGDLDDEEDDPDGESEVSRLFYVPNWPAEFRRRYRHTENDPTARARVAADRIDHFLKTNGAE